MSALELQEQRALLQWAESQSSAKLEAPVSIPQLTMGLRSTFEPFPHFNLFRRVQSVKLFAGLMAARKNNALIDFLSFSSRFAIE